MCAAINSIPLPEPMKSKLKRFAIAFRHNILLNQAMDANSEKWRAKLKLLNKFLNFNDLLVKPSDKGGRVVVMDSVFYKMGCLTLLEKITAYERSTYTAYYISLADLKSKYKLWASLFPDLLKRKQITDGVSALKSPRIGRFYGLP